MVSPFLLALQRSEDIGAALDVHSCKQGGTDEARALGPNNNNHEANSKLAFETLAKIAARSAALGKCRAAHLEEILSRMRLGRIQLRRHSISRCSRQPQCSSPAIQPRGNSSTPSWVK